MRKVRTAQASIFEVFAEHEIGRELQAMSAWLDEHPELLAWVAEDLGTAQVQAIGREGMTAESVLRCAGVSSVGFGFLPGLCTFAGEVRAQEVGLTAEYCVYQGAELGTD